MTGWEVVVERTEVVTSSFFGPRAIRQCDKKIVCGRYTRQEIKVSVRVAFNGGQSQLRPQVD